MVQAHRPTLLSEQESEPFTHGHGAVPPARAAHRYREIAALLIGVARQQEAEEVEQAIHELRKVAFLGQESAHRRVASAELPKLRDEVGIGEEADIEEEISAVGNSMFLRTDGNSEPRPVSPLNATDK